MLRERDQSHEISPQWIIHWQDLAEQKRDFFRRIDLMNLDTQKKSREDLYRIGYTDEQIDESLELSLSTISHAEKGELEKGLKSEKQEYFQKFGEHFPDETKLSQYIRRLDRVIGSRFDAHGIDRGSELQSLINLLTKGVDLKRSFHTMPLTYGVDSIAIGAAAPKSEGGIIVVGPVNTASKRETSEKLMIVDHNAKKTNIQYVILDRVYYQLIPLLSKTFPQVKFIPANQMESVLQNELPLVDRIRLRVRSLLRKNSE